jgi:hypothetical protein
MSSRPRIALRCVASAALLATVCLASTNPPSNSPSDPYDALEFYVGHWRLLDKGHEDYQETCSWLAGDGRRHIICRSTREAPDGPRESLGVYSYEEASREFVYHGFSKRGSIYVERGQQIPHGFRYLSETGAGADRVQTRFTIVEADNGHVNTVNEISKAGGPWVVDEKLEYLRTPL